MKLCFAAQLAIAPVIACHPAAIAPSAVGILRARPVASQPVGRARPVAESSQAALAVSPASAARVPLAVQVSRAELAVFPFAVSGQAVNALPVQIWPVELWLARILLAALSPLASAALFLPAFFLPARKKPHTRRA